MPAHDSVDFWSERNAWRQKFLEAGWVDQVTLSEKVDMAYEKGYSEGYRAGLEAERG